MKGCLRQTHVQPSIRARKWQQPSLWYKREYLPSATAKLALHASEGVVFPDETLLLQVGPKIMWSTIAMHDTHQDGVDCQLAPPKEGQRRTGRFKSRFIQFVPTRPPSLGSCEQRRSRVRTPFCPKTPALAHATRWWPNESIGRPHLQVCKDRGSGQAEAT